MQRTKKIISALLAIVMLMSVLTIGVSAATAPSGSNKTLVYYEVVDADGNAVSTIAPGKEVTVKVFMNSAAANDALSTAFLQIFFNENVYSVDVNTLALSDAYKAAYDSALTALEAYNSSNGNNNFKNALKVAAADGTLTDHPDWNAAVQLSLGTLSGKTYNIKENADTPIATFKLTVKADAAIGADASVGTPYTIDFSKVVSSRGASYHYVKSSTSTNKDGNLEILTGDAVQAVKVGEDAPAFTPLTVTHCREQIRFDKKANGTYNGTFDYRMLATIDNFDEVIGTDYDKVTDVGFIFNKGAAIVEATAKAQVEGGAKTYSQVSNVYVSTEYLGDTYVISCLVNNIADADKGTTLSAMAYVKYVVDGEPYYAYSAVKTSNFEGLYNQYYSDEFGA